MRAKRTKDKHPVAAKKAADAKEKKILKKEMDDVEKRMRAKASKSKATRETRQRVSRSSRRDY